jgi:hypothetical protein
VVTKWLLEVPNVPPATLEIKPRVNQKSLVIRSAFGFIISRAPHFRNSYLTKVTNQLGTTRYLLPQSQSINKVPTRFDVYIKGNRNDIFAARGADIAILTGFGEHLFTKVHGFISNN